MNKKILETQIQEIKVTIDKLELEDYKIDIIRRILNSVIKYLDDLLVEQIEKQDLIYINK